mmetsp:Transcript_159199/g.296785  ORF Transcript_159199/g.296785 Transcript_159199/m.296785 type:complete len:469 (+) Transcript_159199:40-1446(+)
MTFACHGVRRAIAPKSCKRLQCSLLLSRSVTHTRRMGSMQVSPTPRQPAAMHVADISAVSSFPSQSQIQKPAVSFLPKELQQSSEKLAILLPGLAASGAVMAAGGVVAESLGQALLTMQGVTGASPISAIPAAIILGALTRAGVAQSKLAEDAIRAVEPGAKLASGPVLKAGIVCIGAKLSALDLITVGLTGIPAIAASLTAGLMIIPKIAQRFELTEKMGRLISVGTSICGVTAISATAPVIKAEQRETAFAIANVVAFGTLGMLSYPYFAHSVFTHSEQVGLFLGLAVHDTSQVMGSALTYHNVYCDETALKVAAVTKLSRNLCLAGVVPAMALKSSGQTLSNLKLGDVKKLVPGFVISFIGMSALRTLGDATLGWSGFAFYLFDAMQWKEFVNLVGNTASPTLLGIAMAGLGLTLNPSALKGVGPSPFVVGFLGALVVGGTGLVAALALPHVISLEPACCGCNMN